MRFKNAGVHKKRYIAKSSKKSERVIHMIQLIRGFKDILPGEVELWQEIERVVRKLFEDFGFSEIRIPIMERTELFKRGIGEDTDIVEKEMYTFPDRGGELVTLRPEATASICRAYIQHFTWCGGLYFRTGHGDR